MCTALAAYRHTFQCDSIAQQSSAYAREYTYSSTRMQQMKRSLRGLVCVFMRAASTREIVHAITYTSLCIDEDAFQNATQLLPTKTEKT